MGYSSLVSGIIPSPYFSTIVNKKIDSVAIHTMGGDMSAEQCGRWFQETEVDEIDETTHKKTGRKVPLNASSNYGIGSDGTIYGYVDEIDYAYTTSSYGVDSRAITIEVAAINQTDYACSEAAYSALINLLVDICQRHNMTLKWKADKAYAQRAAKGGPVTEQNMFVHRWFANKSCPGNYLYDLHGQIAEEVNSRIRRGYRGNTKQLSSSYITGKNKCIFIGDSRTVMMEIHVKNQDAGAGNAHVWSAKGAQGYYWMVSTGVPNIESKIDSDTAVCILMGVNDIAVNPSYWNQRQTEWFQNHINGWVEKYATYINDKAKEWVAKGAAVYFVSVNPVDPEDPTGYYSIKNEDIEMFNQRLRNNLSSNVGYIDTYSLILDHVSYMDTVHYNPVTSNEIFNIIVSSVRGGKVSISHNSATIGGISIDVDYTQINPYIITLDRNTDMNRIDWDKIQENGVVGAVVEYGSLYDDYRKLYSEFKQPKFEMQKKLLDDHNLEYGYLVTTHARTVEEARSEIKEIVSILRSRPPRLGVWVRLKLAALQHYSINNNIIFAYQKTLIDLGFKKKIGLYVDKREDLAKFTWDLFQDEWILWIKDHVQDESELAQLLTPEFFSIEEDTEKLEDDYDYI